MVLKLLNKKVKDKKKNSNAFEKYAKYSGLVFQMGMIIFIFVWIGKVLDQRYMDDKKVFIIILSLLGVFIALYLAIKDFINFKEKK